MKPAIDNPGAVLKRLLGYVFKYYKVQFIIVFVCIIISVIHMLDMLHRSHFRLMMQIS